MSESNPPLEGLPNLYLYERMLKHLATEKMALNGVTSRAKATSEDLARSALADAYAIDLQLPAPEDDLNPVEEFVKSLLLRILFNILDRKIYKHFGAKDAVLPAYGDEVLTSQLESQSTSSDSIGQLLFDETIEDLLVTMSDSELRDIARMAVIGASVEEIAEDLDISVPTVYRRFAKIKTHALKYAAENL